MKNGLKGSTSDVQFNNRLEHLSNGDFFEFYLVAKDFTNDGLINLYKKCKQLENKGVNIIFHQPMKFKGQRLHLPSYDWKSKEAGDFLEFSTNILVDFALRFNGKIVVHWHYRELPIDTGTLEEKLDYMNSFDYSEMVKKNIFYGEDFVNKNNAKGVILLENSTSIRSCLDHKGVFAETINKSEIDIVFDTNHAFISLNGDMEKFNNQFDLIKNNIKHLHICDSIGEIHGGRPVGSGNIDFKKVRNFLLENPISHIYEIDLENQDDCREMLESKDNFYKRGI